MEKGDNMQEVFVGFVDREIVVYRPGTAEVAMVTSSLDEALAFARGEWPDLGIRVILSEDAWDHFAHFTPRCADCCR